MVVLLRSRACFWYPIWMDEEMSWEKIFTAKGGKIFFTDKYWYHLEGDLYAFKSGLTLLRSLPSKTCRMLSKSAGLNCWWLATSSDGVVAAGVRQSTSNHSRFDRTARQFKIWLGTAPCRLESLRPNVLAVSFSPTKLPKFPTCFKGVPISFLRFKHNLGRLGGGWVWDVGERG